MRDGTPSCFCVRNNRGGGEEEEEVGPQNLVTCTYWAELGVGGGRRRAVTVTVTWCKNGVGQGLCVGVGEEPGKLSFCKVDLRPWFFWRKQGLKRLDFDEATVWVFWDLSSARFGAGPEPREGFYVAVVCGNEAALVLGDMKEAALRRTRAGNPLTEAVLVSRKEHIFGNRYFATRARFGGSGRSHEVGIECRTKGPDDPALLVSVDREPVMEVKRLRWKFRGNDTIYVEGVPVQFLWDVHDWLFSPGLGHAMFVFKPVECVSGKSAAAAAAAAAALASECKSSACFLESVSSSRDGNYYVPSDFFLLLYAWKCD
uniref:TSA: Wollemia nobilis Ref_Wollemi_Transcript_9890_1460 transcribed RNA sequence n=1 Tax=Wollemia nobilis TaxID=56998 RepID=A0A0C9RMX8_9CONI